MNASQDEINAAYRRLSRLYHPDKHSEQKKNNARQLFNKTKTIYEVLSDPHKRAIYDTLGVKGLQLEGWEMIPRTKTPREIREEFERLSRLQEEMHLQQKTNPKGRIVMNVNAVDFFNPYWDDDDEDDGERGEGERNRLFPSLEVSGLTFFQSIEAPLTTKNTALLSGEVTAHNGIGSGEQDPAVMFHLKVLHGPIPSHLFSSNLSVGMRKLLSHKSWAEFDVGMGTGLNFSLKGYRNLSKRSYLTASAYLHATSHGLQPLFVASLMYQLDKKISGHITWKGGAQNGMTTTLVRDSEKTRLVGSLHLGASSSYASFRSMVKLKEVKLRAGIKAGTFGYLLDCGVDKKISDYSWLGASLIFGIPTGVLLRVKLTRSTQTYECNMALCEEVLPAPLLYGSLVPLIMYQVLKALIIDPYQREEKQRHVLKHKEAHAARQKEHKKEAEAALELMKETVWRIIQQEESCQGLIIVKALYGCHASQLGTGEQGQEADGNVIDVTIPLQCLVKDSKLIIHDVQKSQLPGFYDPCIGEEKTIQVEYLFRGQHHHVIVNESEPLRIPKISSNGEEMRDGQFPFSLQVSAGRRIAERERDWSSLLIVDAMIGAIATNGTHRILDQNLTSSTSLSPGFSAYESQSSRIFISNNGIPLLEEMSGKKRLKRSLCERVILTPEVYAICLEHALSTSNEVMGLLVGQALVSGGVMSIVTIIVLGQSDATEDRVEISPEVLSSASEKAEELAQVNHFPLRVVGWYHSHPEITVPPSHIDLETQIGYQSLDDSFIGLIVSLQSHQAYKRPKKLLLMDAMKEKHLKFAVE
ncbi:unnamed protein product [Darwinula stevensoni]|uniref:J domain-containing protein n=1 Tax=Darwinula stevensoni TaxID=69355 RepID=A0A7R9A0H9_9CRUS|nr:unnamed protein product [Darwinula stevensoni]CAG0884656.1 unnamed protein product [Darwinula stevensoni]